MLGGLALLLLGGCRAAAGQAAPPPSPASGTASAVRGEIVVFAAASLTDAYGEIGRDFEAQHPGTRVTLNFGASSQLRVQLEQGARAEVFASADEAQMAAAEQHGILAGTPQVFARNRLTIITPRDDRKGISSLHDLARSGVRLVTAQPNVPIGQYTQTLLARAAADPAYGQDFAARVERNVVSREDNVRQVVGKVALGEADAAIVYTSDVTPQMRGRLRQVPVPDALNVVATYPIAVTSRGSNRAGGEAFVAAVLSPAGQRVLEKWGFLPASS